MKCCISWAVIDYTASYIQGGNISLFILPFSFLKELILTREIPVYAGCEVPRGWRCNLMNAKSHRVRHRTYRITVHYPRIVATQSTRTVQWNRLEHALIAPRWATRAGLTGYTTMQSLHHGTRGGGLVSLWLYKENNKLRDWKKVFSLHIPPELHTLMTSLF
jgi:hypothetical protein